MAVLGVFLVIFLPTTLIAFTKLSFWRSFWWAKPIEILIGSNTTTWITIFVISFYFQFCKKKKLNFLTHKWPFYDHFWPFFGNYIKIFHKAEIQTVILRCFEGQNFNWIKSYNIISIKTIFFHAWKCIISGLVCRSEFWHLLRKSALIFSKWLFFQNSLELSWPK